MELVKSDDLIFTKLAINLVSEMDIKYKYQLLYMLKKKHPPLCWKCTLHNNWPDLQKLIVELVESNELDELPHTPSYWGVCYFNEGDGGWIEKYVSNTEATEFPTAPCCDDP